MDDQNKNLILATALSFLVILIWFVLFPPQEPTPAPEQPQIATTAQPSATAAPVQQVVTPQEARQVALSADARIAIDTPELSGSISLTGGRIDDLKLKAYRETVDPKSGIVTLLAPLGAPGAYQALFGWAPGGTLEFKDVPDANTHWQVESGTALAPGAPVTLVWTNSNGLTFRRVISIDPHFLFTVTQSVTNNGAAPQRLAPESRIERIGDPVTHGIFVVHEGAIRQTGKEMQEEDYSDLRDFSADARWGAASKVVEVESNGWLGFTDHYWMTTLIPAANQPFTSVLQYDKQRDTYRAIARMATIEVAPGETKSAATQFFAGAKRWETIRDYEQEQGIYRFIDSIDWGWFFFLTKPIFRALHFLHSFIGNMGWSIIMLTFCLKALLFPLAYKSYLSMAKMKELQPEMEKIKARVGDDRQKLQQEMMGLYKKEKVNPASGCLPILLQIPIFFSLYKVIFVTIELRQAAWIGWIKDLSAPDPSTIFNIWGLMPWDGPAQGSLMATIFIGILPLLLGISMWLQQKLNPAPADPTQQMIFAWMPWVFMFMLGSFASGLVIYWITNNTLTFMQQYIIMRSHGYKPDVFGNILSGFKRKATKK